MKPFKSWKDAAKWANASIRDGRWVNLSVVVGRDREPVRLRTRIVNGGTGLATLPR